jgi:hypothetical protein
MSQLWYYVDNNVDVGPVSRTQLRLFLQPRRGGRATLVWCETWNGWKRADEVAELAGMLGPAPAPGRSSARAGYAAPAVPIDRRDAATSPLQPAPVQADDGRRKALTITAWIVAACLGTVAAVVFKALIMWPAAFGAIAWFTLGRCKVPPPALPMMAILLGHTGWMLVGYVTLAATGRTLAHPALVDVVIVTGLSIWFLVTRSRAAAIGVLVYQVFAFGGGLWELGDRAPTLGQSLHLLLRVAGVGACIYAVGMLGGARGVDEPADERVA